MLYIENLSLLLKMLLNNIPAATAEISGNGIEGRVNFYDMEDETLVMADIRGLPRGEDCACKVFGFHIHEGESCGGENFDDTKGHYNPQNCPHPCHAGDLPPLFGNGGRAWMVFLTDRFRTDEIIGRTVVIHSSPDDFTTQPAGNSGEKIACGIINRTRQI